MGQENFPKAMVGGSDVVVQPGTSSRKTNVPLADQKVAFNDALQQSTGVPPSIRGGNARKPAEDGLRLVAQKQANARRKNAAKKRKKREREHEARLR